MEVWWNSKRLVGRGEGYTMGGGYIMRATNHDGHSNENGILLTNCQVHDKFTVIPSFRKHACG